ncbi:hypothetical protein [Clostridium perfringens]|jgi:hypothetical protein|uniref:hypothetical protein n=1 Tax=Clostridium perfringens TaxID=1502 RepID=UPI0018AC6271|nr:MULTISPECIES: hypothetical protein [Clostridia]MBI6057651.1 hypothetical protein [Clostridium perfringens]MBW4862274.1 hypothetical protein [Paeniclostridium sp.]MCX0413097.1 hypothetical protein [Clostridium perfringens]MDB2070320.1 hypothetical protein [Clostridium perfringens]MDJ8945286.1 hypothetical protein [Clostridium perfringens]
MALTADEKLFLKEAFEFKLSKKEIIAIAKSNDMFTFLTGNKMRNTPAPSDKCRLKQKERDTIEQLDEALKIKDKFEREVIKRTVINRYLNYYLNTNKNNNDEIKIKLTSLQTYELWAMLTQNLKNGVKNEEYYKLLETAEIKIREVLGWKTIGLIENYKKQLELNFYKDLLVLQKN